MRGMLNFFQHSAHKTVRVKPNKEEVREQKPNHQKLYHLAENQAGYFTTQQAQEAGFSRDLLAHLVSSGKFLRVRQGVYRLTAFPKMPHSEYFQIWIATGMKGVFSHRSALDLYELTDRIPTEFHLTVTPTARRRVANVRYHTSKLQSDEVTTRHGLPVTDVPRTLYDLYRWGESPEWIVQATYQALDRGMISAARLLERTQSYSHAFGKLMRNAIEKRAIQEI